MKLWKISQTENKTYDTYDSAVVAAETEEAARNIVPGDGVFGERYSTWCSGPEKVTVEYLGEAHEAFQAGVVVGSFNAG